MPTKSKPKKLTPGKKIRMNKGSFYCKVELPSFTKFQSNTRNKSPFDLFYEWVRISLESKSSGRLYDLLFSKDKIEIRMDVTKVVLNNSDLIKLEKLTKTWALKYKLANKKGLQLYMAMTGLCYGPSQSTHLEPGFVYVEKDVYFRE